MLTQKNLTALSAALVVAGCDQNSKATTSTSIETTTSPTVALPALSASRTSTSHSSIPDNSILHAWLELAEFSLRQSSTNTGNREVFLERARHQIDAAMRFCTNRETARVADTQTKVIVSEISQEIHRDVTDTSALSLAERCQEAARILEKRYGSPQSPTE